MNAQLTSTWNEVASSVNQFKSRHPLDVINQAMRDELSSAFYSSSTRKEFILKVKARTGLTTKGIKSNKACQYLLELLEV